MALVAVAHTIATVGHPIASVALVCDTVGHTIATEVHPWRRGLVVRQLGLDATVPQYEFGIIASMCVHDYSRIKRAEFEERFAAKLVPGLEQLDEERWPKGDRTTVIRLESGERVTEQISWGLVPGWQKDIKKRPQNARCETVTELPTFREAFAKRRCLLPASGFYEHDQFGSTRRKAQYKISLIDEEPYACAGIWDFHPDVGHSCTMITCSANSLILQIHPRMPVILDPKDYEAWLDPKTSRENLLAMLKPYPSEKMVIEMVVERDDNGLFGDEFSG